MARTALFLVQTPLHVINALEAITEFNIEQSTFFIVASDHNPKWRLMIKQLLPPHAKTIFCTRNDHDIEEGTKAYAQHLDTLKAESLDFVFFADARLYIFVDIVNSLQNPSTILMDDGTGTLLAIHSLTRYGLYYDMSVSRNIERQRTIEAVKIKYGLWNLKPVRYDLFTVFDYEACDYFNVVNNPMKQLCFTHDDQKSDSVLFLGQPFVKINHMTASDYEICLNEICDQFKGKRMLYLPHPREDHTLIESLAATGKITIIHTELTAENFLISQTHAPKTVCGFLSTSLWNIVKFQKGIDVHAFKIPAHRFNEKLAKNRSRSSHVTDLEFINLIYDYYEKRLPVHLLK
ncbi:hypothetical protein ALTERO38_50519 [Alteromonas sp. 38]|uniref:glycosyltransferase family 52 n=1 Tax=Alteromonas TaxID=226 RepID=UPI0012F421C8|nr:MULTISPECIES: glycosyltransferase family 52 [Alteromonas]CAD5285788.1 hypothetical protein ALTER154_80750 [Alteromonas sp. 154]VXB36044.1 hypothetical protein ALTERO38_50519 [Alteromonas sp. 38]